MKFLVKLGDGSGDILKKLRMVHGDRALKVTAIYKQAALYKEGRKWNEDDPRLGRPISTNNDENVKRVDKLLAINQRISNRYIAETLGINRKTVRLIIVEDLRTQKLCQHIVPKSLTEEQKQFLLDVATNWSEQCAADPNFLDRVITSDKSWFFKYDPSDQQTNKANVKEGEPNLKIVFKIFIKHV